MPRITGGWDGAVPEDATMEEGTDGSRTFRAPNHFGLCTHRAPDDTSDIVLAPIRGGLTKEAYRAVAFYAPTGFPPAVICKWPAEKRVLTVALEGPLGTDPNVRTAMEEAARMLAERLPPTAPQFRVLPVSSEKGVDIRVYLDPNDPIFESGKIAAITHVGVDGETAIIQTCSVAVRDIKYVRNETYCAHELLHTLGLMGHLKGRFLMDANARSDKPKPEDLALVRTLGARRPNTTLTAGWVEVEPPPVAEVPVARAAMPSRKPTIHIIPIVCGAPPARSRPRRSSSRNR